MKTYPLALTLGEPSGIGPDITLMAWRLSREQKVPPFYLIADPDYVADRARQLGFNVPLVVTTPLEAVHSFPHALPVVALDRKATARPGEPDESSAAIAIDSIRQAVADVLAGRCAAIVTNPVAKSVLYESGFTDPGQTEFLGKLVGESLRRKAHPVMMLWADELAVVPVTIHLPLSKVFTALTSDLIIRTGRIVAAELTTRFGVKRPRLAVSGLNPHAGESGHLGHEDEAIIAPAISALQAEGIEARGPLPADTMFHAAARATYDAALCMYHDQALIPIKMLVFDRAVNITLGLPFLRASPDHGTAFDIAGTGRADPSSLIAALKLAARLTAGDAP